MRIEKSEKVEGDGVKLYIDSLLSVAICSPMKGDNITFSGTYAFTAAILEGLYYFYRSLQFFIHACFGSEFSRNSGIR